MALTEVMPHDIKSAVDSHGAFTINIKQKSLKPGSYETFR